LNISVVIPVYNRPDLLKRALCSVSKQTTQADEVLVVDDGSSSSPDLSDFHENPEVHCLRREKNLGVSAARNWGISKPGVNGLPCSTPMTSGNLKSWKDKSSTSIKTQNCSLYTLLKNGYA